MAVHKSDAGWRRLQARTKARMPVRVARMDHRVRSAAKPRSVQPLVAQLEPELELEAQVDSVSWCGDCDGPCVCE